MNDTDGLVTAIYARRSLDQDVPEEHRSVTRQADHARRFADTKGMVVNEEAVIVDDAISGAEFEARPGFVRLMTMLKPKPPFQALIVSEESRLGRETIETSWVIKQFIQAGVRVFCYMEGGRERRLDSPTDKILLTFTAYADELEREKARSRAYDAAL